jgi:hypothetical protein
MTKVEPPKAPLSKPPKPISRLAALAGIKVVTAGEAFERDLTGANMQPAKVMTTPAPQPAAPAPKRATSAPKLAVKRTFRYPPSVDGELKKFVHRYNLEKQDQEPELSLEEVGVVMAKHFLGSDPGRITKESRGL